MTTSLGSTFILTSASYAAELAHLRQQTMRSQLAFIGKIDALQKQLLTSEEHIAEHTETIAHLRAQLSEEQRNNTELCRKYQVQAYRVNNLEASGQISEADVRDLEARLKRSGQRIKKLEGQLLKAHLYIEYSLRIDRERITAYGIHLLLAKHDGQHDTAMGSTLTALILGGPVAAIATAVIANTVHQTSNSCARLPSRKVLHTQLENSQAIIDHLRVQRDTLSKSPQQN
jgi:hypothetical protein